MVDPHHFETCAEYRRCADSGPARLCIDYLRWAADRELRRHSNAMMGLHVARRSLHKVIGRELTQRSASLNPLGQDGLERILNVEVQIQD